MKKIKVFISHSSSDKAAVRQIARDLVNCGVDVWLDEWEIKVGDSITQKINMGLRDADFIVVYLTKNAVASRWVQKEWQSKFQSEISTDNVSLLPLLGENCEIPALLADKRYADFRRDYEGAFRELLVAIGLDNAEVSIPPSSQGYERLDEILNKAMAERIASLLEVQQKHRHEIERQLTASERRGQFFALLLSLLAIATAVLMEILDHHTLAIALAVAPFVTLFAIFILSRILDYQRVSKEKANNRFERTP